jgi:CRISP-associated protein Cas1
LADSRQSLLRSARETDSPEEEKALRTAADESLRILKRLRKFMECGDLSPLSKAVTSYRTPQRNELSSDSADSSQLSDGSENQSGNELPNSIENLLDCIRGFEGQGANIYFKAFALHLRQQRLDFPFTRRRRRPALDAMNCLLSFLYALVRHDCIAALCATGLDPFVGYLHADRPNRPGLALDLMEEFRPLIADRLAITLVNRRQIEPKDFVAREGGAFELKKDSRKTVIAAYQTRKQDVIRHPLLNQEVRVGHLMLVQARILARHLRGDIPEYLPCVLR